MEHAADKNELSLIDILTRADAFRRLRGDERERLAVVGTLYSGIVL